MPTSARPMLIGLLLVGAGAAAAYVYYLHPAEPMRMQVVSALGDVRVGGQQVDADGPDLTADGATITTGENGLVSIRLEDGSLVQLSPGSRLDIGSARRNRLRSRFDTDLKLDSGEILRRVPHGDGIRRRADLGTATANLGVRGTEFILVEDAGDSAVSVIRGLVAVGDTAGAESDIGENYGLRVSESGLGTPEVLPPPPAHATPDRGTAIRSEDVSLAWTEVENASRYLVEVAADESFATLLERRYSDGTAITLPGLAWDAPLYWRVATRNENGLLGRSSDPWVLHYRAHFQQLAAAASDPALAARVESLIEPALEGYPDDAPALKAAGWVKYLLGKLDQSRPYYDRAVAADGTDLEARLERARVAYWQKDFAVAEADYRHVLEIQPQDLDALWGLADVRAGQGQLDEALERLDTVLERVPEHVDALRSKARVLRELGDEEAATELLERVKTLGG